MPLQGLVDLGDQFAHPVTGAQLQRSIGLGRCPIGEVGFLKAAVLEVLQGLVRLLKQLLAPPLELAAKVLPHHGIHELFAGHGACNREADKGDDIALRFYRLRSNGAQYTENVRRRQARADGVHDFFDWGPRRRRWWPRMRSRVRPGRPLLRPSSRGRARVLRCGKRPNRSNNIAMLDGVIV